MRAVCTNTIRRRRIAAADGSVGVLVGRHGEEEGKGRWRRGGGVRGGFDGGGGEGVDIVKVERGRERRRLEKKKKDWVGGVVDEPYIHPDHHQDGEEKREGSRDAERARGDGTEIVGKDKALGRRDRLYGSYRVGRDQHGDGGQVGEERGDGDGEDGEGESSNGSEITYNDGDEIGEAKRRRLREKLGRGGGR